MKPSEVAKYFFYKPYELEKMSLAELSKIAKSKNIPIKEVMFFGSTGDKKSWIKSILKIQSDIYRIMN